MVARHLKGGGKDRDDLYAETLPMEARQLLMSTAFTTRSDGRRSRRRMKAK